MAESLGTALLELGTDDSGLNSGLSKAEKSVKTSASSMVKTMAVAAAAMAAAVGAGKIFGAAIREGEQLERNLFRTKAIIKATGGAAGRSADQLHQQARALAMGTLESTEGIMRAQQTMLTFRSIQGDVFDEAIKAALDLSATIGMDVNSTVIQLGKALEDPVKGLSALSRGGTVFTDSQKDMVKTMVEAGDIMGAQKLILAELAAQYGGVAAAEAAGLAGAQDTLNQLQQEWLLKLNKTLGLTALAILANETMSEAVLFLTEHMNELIGIVAAAIGAVLIGFAPAMASAAVATGVLIASLITLRAALIATGIGILVVAVGFLIGKFLDLSDKVGGVGNAFTLVGAVFSEVSGRIGLIIKGLAQMFTGLGMVIKSTFKTAFIWIGGAINDFIVVPLGNAINGIIDMANKLGGSFDHVDVSLTADKTTLLRSGGAETSGSDFITGGMVNIGAAINDPLESVAALRDAMAGVTDETNNAEASAEQLNAALEGLGDGSGGSGGGGGAARAVEDVKDEVFNLADGMKSIESSAQSAFTGFVTGAKSAKEALADVLRSLAQMFANKLFQSLFSGPTSIIGKIFSFDGGGFTGTGPRTGGVDGHGGFPAILHPNESVIDHTKGQSGGQTVVRVDLGPGLVGSILQQAGGQSVQITGAGMAVQDRKTGANLQNFSARHG